MRPAATATCDPIAPTTGIQSLGPSGLVSAPDADALLAAFRDALPVDDRIEAHLGATIRDILDHPGRLIRAQLAFRVQSDRGVEPAAARDLAVAIEYFHTASLVFDDLPSMDDAKTRRGRPCPHLVYGEASAVLGALALITRGYALLWRCLDGLTAERPRGGVEPRIDRSGRRRHPGRTGARSALRPAGTSERGGCPSGRRRQDGFLGPARAGPASPGRRRRQSSTGKPRTSGQGLGPRVPDHRRPRGPLDGRPRDRQDHEP